MRSVRDYMADNEKLIKQGQSGGENAGRWKSMMTGGMLSGGGTENFGDVGGAAGTPGPSTFVGESYGDVGDATGAPRLMTPDEMMRRSTRGSAPFSKAEIARGYRKL